MSQTDLTQAFAARYSDAPAACADGAALLQSMAARGSCRAFEDRAVPQDVLDSLCAIAMASPTKSDLQQRDIVMLRSPDQRQRLAALVAGQAWVAQAPMLLVFCGNNRRQRLLHDWHEVPFANDHLDALINAAADAAIALGAFATAAEAMGLGCCPISAVRNDAGAVSDLLGLPDHVFPFAGLALGYPAAPVTLSKRLPLGVTCHVDRYKEEELRAAVEAYDKDRAATQPYGKQRFVDRFGQADTYGWSDDKVRQYSAPERAEFGAFIRKRGFCLD
ncbi:nitroreductase family protein [Tateyamaria sp. syn59]|uniref:nitroreductase family protein n=1 Tax=Tateyamaria sp. syn59 TaxID=2576942 RepID=UPI0011BE224C|nr:nitroreductase family protein [Tateyamaria sp. syn59]